MTKKILLVILFLIGLITLITGAVLLYQKYSKPTTFEACKEKGYTILETSPEQCKTPDGTIFVKVSGNAPVSISGEIVCLPHKVKDGPQTLECAFGIKDKNDIFYALSDPEMKYVTNYITGKKIKVTGTLLAVTDSKYDIVGAISIESMVTE